MQSFIIIHFIESRALRVIKYLNYFHNMKMKNTVLVIGLFETFPTLDIEIFINTFIFFNPYLIITLIFSLTGLLIAQSPVSVTHICLSVPLEKTFR